MQPSFLPAGLVNMQQTFLPAGLVNMQPVILPEDSLTKPKNVTKPRIDKKNKPKNILDSLVSNETDSYSLEQTRVETEQDRVNQNARMDHNVGNETEPETVCCSKRTEIDPMTKTETGQGQGVTLKARPDMKQMMIKMEYWKNKETGGKEERELEPESEETGSKNVGRKAEPETEECHLDTVTDGENEEPEHQIPPQQGNSHRGRNRKSTR